MDAKDVEIAEYRALIRQYQEVRIAIKEGEFIDGICRYCQGPFWLDDIGGKICKHAPWCPSARLSALPWMLRRDGEG